MEILQIRVVDFVQVKDIVVQVCHTVQQLLTWIGNVIDQIVPQQEIRSPEEGRSPPTLNINVREVIKTIDRPFGN